MLEKQVQFSAFDARGQLVIQPLFLDNGLVKTAEALEMRSKLHPRVQDFVRAVRPTSSGIYVLVNALGAGEYWGSNVNGDLFPEKALIHSPPDWENLLVYPDRAREVGMAWPYGYPTFMGAYPYKHHVNKDPSRAFGKVELATWNPEMHRVELVVYLDRALCMQFDAVDIIERIERGEFPDVSMGCKVPYDVCTICENPSKTRNDYCQHALTMMNKILPDGRKVAVRNDYPKFFDISFVFIGADKTAKVMAKLAQKGNKVCMGDFCTIPHLSADVGAEFPKEASWSDHWNELSDPLKRSITTGVLGLGAGLVGGYTHGRVFPRIGPTTVHAQSLDNISPDYISRFGEHLNLPKDRQEAVSGIARTARLARPVISNDPTVSLKRTGKHYLAEIDNGALDIQGRKAPIVVHGTWRPGDSTESVVSTVKSKAKVPPGHTKIADPIDENPNNIGVTKEKAIADQEMARRVSLQKVTSPSIAQPVWDKYASRHIRTLRDAALGAGIGVAAGAAGNAAIKSDRQTFKKDAIKDAVAGSLAGAIAKLAEEPEVDGPRVSQDELIRQGVAAVPGTSHYISEDGLRNRARNYRFDTLRAYLKEKNTTDLSTRIERFKLRRPDRAHVFDKLGNDPIKKKIKVQGVPICLEWLKGETREYKKGGVVKYKRLMEADYGYIPGTVDSDGEELDVYVGPDRDAKNAYVIRQMKKTGGFDEHKVMLGYASKGAAKASYIHHMGGTPEYFGGMQTIPVSSLVALFGDNKARKEKVACSCHGVGDDCGGSIEKLASLLFPVSKSASHAKLGDIIKSLPAGPFTKETLPKLESAEKDIPNDVLDNMGSLPLGAALSTPTMAGMVLKPREFQRIILMSIGERPLADDLDNKGMTFGQTKDVDDSIPIGESSIDDTLMGLLCRLGVVHDRSAAGPALKARSATSASADKPFRPLGPEKTASGILMSKLAALYNGYRRNILRKAASISNFITTDPQLRSELFGSSMVQAFAGGIDKVASASIFSPDSLAYLLGAYTDRDLHITNEVIASLAQTGAIVEAA